MVFFVIIQSARKSLFSSYERLLRRRLALPVLPNGDPTLIVRVLEAFMALQFQAGVLTEEMVLAVQELVEVSIFQCRSWPIFVRE